MEIRIDKKTAGLSIKEYFVTLHLSSRLITKLKNRARGITVNGEKKTVRYLLHEGDLLKLEIEDQASSKTIKPSFAPLNVLFEDEHYIAVEKEPYLPIHPSRNHVDDTLASRVMAYFEGQNFVFRVLTRLDRDTSGAVIIAKNPIAAAEFSRLLTKREVKKEYLAICEGIFDEKRGEIDFNIRRPSPFNIMREAIEKCEPQGENTPFGTDALSVYRVLKENGGHSLVSFSPVTGRTHQLRVHALKFGHPIIGDTLYNKESDLISRQALHAERLTFIHPFTKKEVTVICPIPADIKNATSRLGLN